MGFKKINEENVDEWKNEIIYDCENELKDCKAEFSKYWQNSRCPETFDNDDYNIYALKIFNGITPPAVFETNEFEPDDEFCSYYRVWTRTWAAVVDGHDQNDQDDQETDIGEYCEYIINKWIEDQIVRILKDDPSKYFKHKGFINYLIEIGMIDLPSELKRPIGVGLWDMKTEMKYIKQFEKKKFYEYTPSDILNRILNCFRIGKTRALLRERQLLEDGTYWIVFTFNAKKKYSIPKVKEEIWDQGIAEIINNLNQVPEIENVSEPIFHGRFWPFKPNGKIGGQLNGGECAYEISIHIKKEFIPVIQEEFAIRKRSKKVGLWDFKTFEAYAEEAWTIQTWANKMSELISSLTNKSVKELTSKRDLSVGQGQLIYRSPVTEYTYKIIHQKLHEYKVEIFAYNIKLNNFKINDKTNLIQLKEFQEIFNFYETVYFDNEIIIALNYLIDEQFDFEKFKNLNNIFWKSTTLDNISQKAFIESLYKIGPTLKRKKDANIRYNLTHILVFIYNTIKSISIAISIFLPYLYGFGNVMYNSIMEKLIIEYYEEHPGEYLENLNQLKQLLPPSILKKMAYLERGSKVSMWDYKMAMSEGFNFDDVVKISLKKLSDKWNPFQQNIWVKLDKPITRKEIKDAIENNDLISVDVPVKKYLIWDESTREEHIARIAWLVINYSEKYPIDIDFGIPSMGSYFEISDGNHRLAAAYYLNKDYIYANVSGAVSEIEKYTYR